MAGAVGIENNTYRVVFLCVLHFAVCRYILVFFPKNSIRNKTNVVGRSARRRSLFPSPWEGVGVNGPEGRGIARYNNITVW